MRQPDAVVVRGAPDPGVGRHRHTQLAGHLVGDLLRERRVAGDVEGHLEAEHVVGGVDVPPREAAELGRGGPLPRSLLDVPVGEHPASRNRAQRVDRGVGVVRGLQPVRPVDAGGHAGVERLPRCEHVPGVHVLRPEVLAGLQVVPDEVLGDRPVRAVAAHHGLPHVPVGVDHAGQHDAVPCVDLHSAVRHCEVRSDLGDPIADDEYVGRWQHSMRTVHRQHRAAAQHHRGPARRLVGRHLIHPFTRRRPRRGPMSDHRSSSTSAVLSSVPRWVSILGSGRHDDDRVRVVRQADEGSSLFRACTPADSAGSRDQEPTCRQSAPGPTSSPPSPAASR